MKNFGVLITFLLLLACGSIPEEKEIATIFEPGNAQWIEDERELPTSDSLFYLEYPAPLFRKTFQADRTVKKATLFITAAGYYKASLNGSPIGDNVLDPAWTDFSKRIYYTEYDVTSLLAEGTNCLGVALGNGFYNPLPLRKWGHRDLRKDLAMVGKPTFLAKLHLAYQDGTSEEVVSDSSWHYSYGPLLKNSVYLGVTYDARREINNWDHPDLEETDWETAKISQGPRGVLQRAFFPGVQITEEITPIEIFSPEAGVWMVDMGVNFTGTYKIRLSGMVGDTITFRFGERLYEDKSLNPMTAVIGQIKRKGVGGPGAPDIAWQTDSYVIGDDESSWFEPEFTYHTYRYMEIRGLEQQPQLSDIRGLFMHSNLESDGQFSCSSDLLNDIQEATLRTFRANLVSVQSDCPAREKFGYGGDINATSESFIYNFDMRTFYRKTLYDWVDAMKDSVFVDTAPFTGIQYCGISWESAFLITQYYLYLYYNDTDLIREFYDLDKAWMDKVARIHPDGIVDKGLSDHESLEPVPVSLTGTGHYLQCARIMHTFASYMGDTQRAERYEQLADRLKQLIKAKYWDEPVTEKINRQTLFSTLLFHDIVPKDEIAAATDSLLQAVQNGPSGHLNTGIFGTKYVLETLSEHSSPDAVFDIVNSTTYPGWGHMIDRGATTIWETWKESDNTYSNCHPMFGSVTEWYYRWLAGIRPDPAFPGFERFTLAPSIPEGLISIDCTYESPFGPIVSNWKQVDSNTYQYEMSIPAGSQANVILPVNGATEIEINKDGRPVSQTIAGLPEGKFVLEEGNYTITISYQM